MSSDAMMFLNAEIRRKKLTSSERIQSLKYWLPRIEGVSYNQRTGQYETQSGWNFINEDSRCGWTLLLTAVELNDLEVASWLLELGADPNAPYNDGTTPLSKAEQIGNVEMIRRLRNPKFFIFTKAIDEMMHYAENLKNQNIHKGEVAYDLACQAKTLSQSFFNRDASYINKNLSTFKTELSKLLNSKNDQMSEYRVNWQTIIINVLIALTGIGAVALALHMISSKNSVGRSLMFFSKSRTTCEEKIDRVSQLVAQLA